MMGRARSAVAAAWDRLLRVLRIRHAPRRDVPSLKGIAEEMGTMFSDSLLEAEEEDKGDVDKFRSWVAFFAWGQQHGSGPTGGFR